MTLPNGTVVWKMGHVWGTLSPNGNGEYLSENTQYFNYPPDGITDMYKGRGSFKRSVQILGTAPENLDVTINLGWANAHLSMVNGKVLANIPNASETATKRWKMGVISRKRRPYQRRIPFSSQETITPIIDTDDYVAQKHIRQARIAATWEWLRSEVYIRDKGICWVCNEFVLLGDYHLGHLVDRHNGGHDALDNCTVMHKGCNYLKPSHHSLEEALTWRLTYKNRNP